MSRLRGCKQAVWPAASTPAPLDGGGDAGATGLDAGAADSEDEDDGILGRSYSRDTVKQLSDDQLVAALQECDVGIDENISGRHLEDTVDDKGLVVQGIMKQYNQSREDLEDLLFSDDSDDDDDSDGGGGGGGGSAASKGGKEAAGSSSSAAPKRRGRQRKSQGEASAARAPAKERHACKWEEVNEVSGKFRHGFKKKAFTGDGGGVKATGSTPQKRTLGDADEPDPHPLFCWSMMFSDAMKEMIVTDTNKYAKFRHYNNPAGSEPLQYVKDWQDLTIKELETWIAITYELGLRGGQSVADFFSTDDCLQTPIVGMLGMSRSRYIAIKNLLHCQDDYSPAGKQDRDVDNELRKIEDLLQEFLKNCRDNYEPGQTLAYDEMMIKWTGLLKMKFTKMPKPIRDGIKALALCADSGYLVNLRFDKRNGVCQDEIMLSVLDPISGNNHHVIADNAFISVSMMKETLAKGIYLTGTSERTSKRGFPEELLAYHAKKRPGGINLLPGEWRTKTAILVGGVIFAYSWYDSGVCHFMSSFCPPEHAEVPRASMLKDQPVDANSSRERPMRECPLTAKVYNGGEELVGGMGLVDRNDSMRASYTVHQAGRKWWHAIFFFILDVAAINAWIIYCQKNGLNYRKVSQAGGRKKFMRELIKRLGRTGQYAPRFDAGDGTVAADVVSPQVPGSEKRRKVRTMLSNGQNNFPECSCPLIMRIHPKEAATPKDKRMNCRNCYRKDNKSKTKSYHECAGCSVVLCTDCMPDWPGHHKFIQDAQA